MEVAALLERVRRDPRYAGQLAHVEVLAPRRGRYADPARPLPDLLRRLLAASGAERLYVHQAAALEAARAGRDWVVVTGTASGKTLCYHLPILEACCADPEARALYLFPTKALAQDQLRGLREFLSADGEASERIEPGVYDGDTPPPLRRRIKAEANLVLTNPDMLHAALLPYHPKWGRFFSHLKYVVLDEVHTYRGILGANVACVLRRLLRICRHYGSQPLFLAASATIANPGDVTSRLIGRGVEVIDDDGSPRGRKTFVLWNPRPSDGRRAAGRSAADDAVWLMIEAAEAGGRTLAFTRTRQAAELISRYVQEQLRAQGSPLAQRVRSYRGGYLPRERRRIEQELFHGRLLAVAATNALELGVDIGSLDAALLVQYPGTIASAWQQAGRSGRRRRESLAVLLAGADPVDQYLLRHPDYFFAQTPEHAVVDPENPYVLAKHLRAAAFELPLDEAAEDQFGPLAPSIVEVLCGGRQLQEAAGKFYFCGVENPARQFSLRHMSDNTYSIVQRRPSDPSAKGKGDSHHVIANVDAISAPELVYPEAVYLHNGESYLVRELDLEGKVAYVQRRETDYYTQAVLESNVRITHPRSSRALQDGDGARRAELAFGEVDVRWKTVAFKKIKFRTRENVGFGSVDIPDQNLPTTAFWLAPEPALRAALKREGHRVAEGVSGVRNLAVVALPMVAMCDSRDISGVVDSKNLGKTALILYDRYPGGLGYCEKGYQHIGRLLEICREMVAECPCADGCPSCVGLPNLRPAIHSDPDLMRGYPIPNKAAAHRLLQLLTAEQTAAWDEPAPARSQ